MLPGTPSTKSKLARNVSTHTRAARADSEQLEREARHAHPTAYYLYNFLQQGADILSRQVKRKQPKRFCARALAASLLFCACQRAMVLARSVREAIKKKRAACTHSANWDPRVQYIPNITSLRCWAREKSDSEWGCRTHMGCFTGRAFSNITCFFFFGHDARRRKSMSRWHTDSPFFYVVRGRTERAPNGRTNERRKTKRTSRMTGCQDIAHRARIFGT